jgi:hypothetical protein
MALTVRSDEVWTNVYPHPASCLLAAKIPLEQDKSQRLIKACCGPYLSTAKTYDVEIVMSLAIGGHPVLFGELPHIVIDRHQNGFVFDGRDANDLVGSFFG